MREPFILLTLGMCLFMSSVASAELYYDFDDKVVPSDFIVTGYLQSLVDESSTVSATADGGYLTLTDSASLRPFEGGTRQASVLHTNDFSGNIRVSADVNVDGASNDLVYVMARRGKTDYTGYSAWLSLLPNDYPGQLLVAKAFGGGRLAEYTVIPGAVNDLSRSYRLELEVTDDPVTGYPEVTARLYDTEGGELLSQGSFVDQNVGGVPPYYSGLAGVGAEVQISDVLHTTFDNLRIVPEPSSALLLALGLLGLAVRQRRGRM